MLLAEPTPLLPVVAQLATKPLADDAFVLALLNRGGDAANITASFSLLETDGSFLVRDLWAEEDLGTFSDAFSATVDSHDLGVYRLTRK